MTEENPPLVRRKLSSRDTAWARGCAAALARAGIAPNTISWASVACAAGAGICFWATAHVGTVLSIFFYVAAAALIQGRLLCNLFDGMVAVEHGKKSKSGEIFNDLPDRISDPLILIGAGYAAGALRYGIELGYLAGLLAVMTAYVRTLAGSAGATQSFMGPMAKQHRMALMTIAAIAAALFAPWHGQHQIVRLALLVVVIGCAVTIVRRTRRAISELEAK